MSTEVQSSPRSPVPLTFLLLVNAVLLAVRDLLSSFVDVDRLSSLLLAGEVAAVRLVLAPIATPVAPPSMTPAYKVAALAVLGALDGAQLLGPERPPRRFHGEVALKGHRDLGMCLVEEQRLGGVQVIRCTRLCVDPPEVHWTRADNVYDLREVHEDEALQAAADAAAAREKERREREEQLQRLRDLRAQHDVTVQRRGQFVQVVCSGQYGHLRITDGPSRAALRAAGFGGRMLHDGGSHNCLGLVDGYLSRDDAEQAAALGSPLCEALANLGFRSVTVLPASEDDESLRTDGAQDDGDCDAEVPW